MTLRVLTGLLIGLALALGLSPLSRLSLLEAFRPASSPLALTAPFTALRLPSPDDPQAASAWMMAWLAERHRGSAVSDDQKLLLTEIAQAGRTSEPNNAYWQVCEGLLLHDLGNQEASAKALKGAIRAAGFNSHSTQWAKAVLRDLRRRDGASRPVHLLAVSEAIKAWIRAALNDPGLPLAIPESNGQIWVEGFSRIDFPGPTSLEEAGLAQLPLALSQSIVFWGGATSFLSLLLMHKSFLASRRALSQRMKGLPAWLTKRVVFAPLLVSVLLCVALGGPGRQMQGFPQTPGWLFWTALAIVLGLVAAASAAEEDPDQGARPGWTASSCAALCLTGGILLLASSAWAHAFALQLERALGSH